MSFSCPHFDLARDACRRLKTDCVPGRPGCVIVGAVFAVPVEQRLREREEEKRRAGVPSRDFPDLSPPSQAP